MPFDDGIHDRVMGRSDDGQMPFDDGSMSRSTVDHLLHAVVYIYLYLFGLEEESEKHG
jgi:hypothetical protein